MSCIINVYSPPWLAVLWCRGNRGIRRQHFLRLPGLEGGQRCLQHSADLRPSRSPGEDILLLRSGKNRLGFTLKYRFLALSFILFFFKGLRLGTKTALIFFCCCCELRPLKNKQTCFEFSTLQTTLQLKVHFHKSPNFCIFRKFPKKERKCLKSVLFYFY